MQKAQTIPLNDEKRDAGSVLRRFVEELTFFVGLTVTFILPLVAYYSYADGPEEWKRWFVFLCLLCVLEGVIVGIATYERQKNRDVIQLGRRLAKIYLVAIRKSALNPQTRSPTLDD
jgi:hypothetical protein